MLASIPGESLVEEKALGALLQLLRLKRSYIEDIVIGCRRTPEDYLLALRFKEIWEQSGGFDEEGGTVLDIVSWNSQSSSFNKYCNRIAQHCPDAFVVIGMTREFKEINKCLHKRSTLTADNIYILGDYDASLKSLFIDQLSGVSRSGEPWKVTQQFSHQYHNSGL